MVRVLYISSSYFPNPISLKPKLLVGNGNDQTYLCLVLTADRGLCGGFNSNICRLAKINFKKILDEGKELKIITVG